MVVHHVRLDAENPGGCLDLAGAPLGQLPAGHDGVANVAVGGGDEFHLVPKLGPHGGNPAGLEFAVVGMRAEDHDAQLAVVSTGPGGEQAAEDCRCQKCETVSSDVVFFHGCDWWVRQAKALLPSLGFALSFVFSLSPALSHRERELGQVH